MQNQLCIVENAAERFLPLTWFRPVYDLRCGIRTLREKIIHAYDASDCRLFCRPYLAATVALQSAGVAVNQWPDSAALLVNGRVLAQHDLAVHVPLQDDGDVIYVNDHDVVAVRASAPLMKRLARISDGAHALEMFDDLPHISVPVKTMQYPWDLLYNNGHEISVDAYYLHADTFGVEHKGLVHESAVVDWPDRVTIEEGALVKAGVVLDAEHGPIVIARNAVVMPGAVIEGPAYVGAGSLVKVHANIYGDTSIGPVCKVGGEVECSIIHGCSNKQHDGFLGHSYIGEWVNLGAGTDTSDLKNNYGHVRVQIGMEAVDTGLTFMGALVGDHTKTAIGSTLNTGAVVGPCCNIFGAGLPPKFVPAFSWGGGDLFETYDLERCMAAAATVMKRRQTDFSETTEALFREVFRLTADERAFAGVEMYATT